MLRFSSMMALVVVGCGGGGAATTAPINAVAVTVEAAPQPTASTLPRAACPAGMTAIRGGAFTMGSDDGKGVHTDADEKPAHRVTVAAFCLDTTEVTVDAYAACVKSKACAPLAPPEPSDKYAVAFCHVGKPGLGSHPVNCVDWNEASAYCRAQGKRLPREDEWEFAAKGGAENRTYPWGSEAPEPERTNACGVECVAEVEKQLGHRYPRLFEESDGHATTAPVGSFEPGDSRDGVHDLAGNVYEWTASAYCPYPFDTACAGTDRVIRGGSWFSNRAQWLRAADRGADPPTMRAHDMGFRCAK